jgi:hypothetical protein
MDSIMHKHKNRVKDNDFLENDRNHLSRLLLGFSNVSRVYRLRL